MKVAIVHDYIKEYGGAERVLESLHNVFPDAPIYTSVYLPKFLGPHRSRFENWNIKTSWADAIPFNDKLISPIRLIAPELFKSLDLSDYDVVIVSATGAYSPNNITTRSYKNEAKKAIHICYCHTPPRYLYGYETARDWKKNPLTKNLGELAIRFLRKIDFKSSQNVDYFIANSEETKKRIEKFYKKDSVVIYPPVEIKNHELRIMNQEDKEYYLAGGRIARSKHTDLIVDTFIKNGLPLKIFGKGFAGFEEELRGRVRNKTNIEMLGEISDEEKDRLMAGARAFIFASEDEDFGIVPVEAMMSGTPIIAHRSGGVLETVVEGKTGVFFDEFTVESLDTAIKKFEKSKFDQLYLIKHAQKFGKERFEREIREFVDKVANKKV